MRNLLSRWPLMRQLTTGSNGTGQESMSEATRSLRPRHDGAEVTRSVCPFCAVGCGQLDLPPQGARGGRRRRPAVADLGRAPVPQRGGHARANHPSRTRDEGQVQGAPLHDVAGPRSRGRHGHDRRACLGVARAAFRRAKLRSTSILMQCPSIAHLGGATLDNEENYLIKKLFAGGLGMVAISNQARI